MVPLAQVNQDITRCANCPELRHYCSRVAAERKPAFARDRYWGRPVPGFGDPAARIVIVGLAPAAHGANRTGRMFTGDRSGDFLFAGLHRAGLASQPTSIGIDDGLVLRGVYITAALRCAPPANRPSPRQLQRCAPWLVQELAVLRPRVLLCLGGIAWDAAIRAMGSLGAAAIRPRPKFGHGARCDIHHGTTLLGCYHVSQQNTFTGRLTADMLDRAIAQAARLAWGE